MWHVLLKLFNSIRIIIKLILVFSFKLLAFLIVKLLLLCFFIDYFYLFSQKKDFLSKVCITFVCCFQYKSKFIFTDITIKWQIATKVKWLCFRFKKTWRSLSEINNIRRNKIFFWWDQQKESSFADNCMSYCKNHTFHEEHFLMVCLSLIISNASLTIIFAVVFLVAIFQFWHIQKRQRQHAKILFLIWIWFDFTTI